MKKNVVFQIQDDKFISRVPKPMLKAPKRRLLRNQKGYQILDVAKETRAIKPVKKRCAVANKLEMFNRPSVPLPNEEVKIPKAFG